MLPAMSRIALLPVPIRVSWYRPLASAVVEVKLSFSAPGPPLAVQVEHRYGRVDRDGRRAGPVKLPLGADWRSWIWAVVK